MLSHTKIISGGLSAMVLAVIIHATGGENIFIQSAFAQTPTNTSNIFNDTGDFAVLLLTFMHFMTFVVIYILQGLLDPGFLTAIMVNTALKDIWIFSRDIMNILFAFMLVSAGVFTVVTGNKELILGKYKRFIIAIILVNFSWFFPRVIIDVANVLTATVYQLPSAVETNDCTYKNEKGEKVPCVAIENILLGTKCKKMIADQGGKNTDDGYYGYAGNTVCAHYEVIGSAKGPGKNTSKGMLNGLVLGYGRLTSLPLVLNPDAGVANAGGKIDKLTSYFFYLIHVLLITALMAMLFLPLLSMLVVFIIRIPIIWFTIAFMPFMFLGFVAEDKLTPGFNTFEIFKKFVKAAFLPVAVAVPLSIGFILLGSLSNDACVDVFDAGSALQKTFCFETGEIISGINNVWAFMWLMMTFLVIWIGFYSALKIDETYVNVTNGIRSFGSNIGQAALKIPLSIPIPTGTGKSVSINQANSTVRRLSSNLSNKPFGKAFGDTFGGKDGKNDGKNVVDALKDPSTPINKALTTIAQSNSSNYDQANGKFKDRGFQNFKGGLDIHFDSKGNLDPESELAKQIHKETPGGISNEELQKIKKSDVIDNIKKDHLETK